jgi:diguanylate cyclase (GGDEF)-like protein/PAS domain S-box-containing protein
VSGPGGPGAAVALNAAGGLVEQVGEAVVVSLPGGPIVSWNAAAMALYGYEPDEALGRPMAQLVPPEHRDTDDELRRRVLAGERLVGVPVVRRHRDGRILELDADLFPVPGAFSGDEGSSAISAAVHAADGGGATGAGPTVDDLEAAIRLLPGVVFVADLDGRIIYSAGAGLERLGLEQGEAVGVNVRDFTADPAGLALAEDLIAGMPYHGPFAVGDEMWILSCAPVVVDGVRTGGAGVLTSSEVTWSQAHSVARSQARYQALAEHSSDLVCVIDAGARVSYVSPSVERLLGWRPDEVVGRPATDFVRTEGLGAVGDLLEDLRDGVPHVTPRGGRTHTITTRLRRADGSWCDYEIVTSDYLDDPSIGGFVVNGRDVTERRQADLRLRHASLHDALTDLPNRALLIQEVESTLLHIGPAAAGLAVVVIGLDRFKLVNDSLGHETGDHLLVAVGRRLRRQVRASDTVARLGGDTFVVTTTGVSDAADARALANRLIAVVAEPYDLAGRRIAVTAGAGVAVSGPEVDGTTLVRNADTAMYAAKRRGRSRVELFEPKLRADAARQLSLEQSLSRATSGDELRVHFQPIMALTGRPGEPAVTGVEALVRWEHPDLGLVPPLDFIPLAEETGHIIEIGSWVLRESCRTLMGWTAAPERRGADGSPERRGADGSPDRRGADRSPLGTLIGPPLRLAVNLSPRQLLEPDLPDVVADVLRETGFPAERLTMEVTESVLVDEGPYATTTLQRLRDMGVRLSIDDFGTGYSSLVYLRRLNADALKIDRSFVDGLGRDSEADTIVRAVIGLARSLGLDLVAEGVETEEQRRLLVELGCHFAQGYLFSRPLPAPAFVEWRATGGGLLIRGT